MQPCFDPNIRKMQKEIGSPDWESIQGSNEGVLLCFEAIYSLFDFTGSFSPRKNVYIQDEGIYLMFIFHEKNFCVQVKKDRRY